MKLLSSDAVWSSLDVFPGGVVLLPATQASSLQPVRPPGLDPLLLQNLCVIQNFQAWDLTDHILSESDTAMMNVHWDILLTASKPAQIRPLDAMTDRQSREIHDVTSVLCGNDTTEPGGGATDLLHFDSCAEEN